MPQDLRFGLIGLGKMGRIRFRTLSAMPGVSVVVGADPDTASYGSFPDLSCTADWKAVLEAPVDAVMVCTPNWVTADAIVAALDAGKHVFAEKPPGRSVRDIERVISAEARHPHLRLKFGFNHRYHAGIKEAKEILDSGRLGRLLWARAIYGKSGGPGFEREWRNQRKWAGGGILLDQGIHMLDLLRYFLGDFVEVKSMVTRAFWPIDVEDNAFVLLRDSEGRIAMVHSSSTQWKHRFLLELYAEEGFLSVNGILSSSRTYGDETITVGHKRFDQLTATGKPREEVVYFDTDPSWELEIIEFIDAIRGDGDIVFGSSADALEAMKLVQRIYEADASWTSRAATDGASPVHAATRDREQRVVGGEL